MDHSMSDEPPQEGSRAGASRLRILQTLRQAPAGLGVQELAAQVGLHVNTVRFHLDHLVAEGVVARDVEERTEPGRPRLTFTALPGAGSHGDRRSYRLLAAILASFVAASVPDAAEAAAEAGRTWGHYLTQRPGPYRRTDEAEAIGELLRILDEIGFVPELADSKPAHAEATYAEATYAEATHAEATHAESGREIRVRHCPFLEVAEEHREVVCAVHLGLMQGALAEMRAPVTAERLAPFVEPSLCVATLGEA
jgi:predicted ArsR family transcriptional regulator